MSKVPTTDPVAEAAPPQGDHPEALGEEPWRGRSALRGRLFGRLAGAGAVLVPSGDGPPLAASDSWMSAAPAGPVPSEEVSQDAPAQLEAGQEWGAACLKSPLGDAR